MSKSPETRKTAGLLAASAVLMIFVLLLFYAMARMEERSPEEVLRDNCRDITKWEFPKSAHFTDEETRYAGADSQGNGGLHKTLFHLKLDRAGYDLLAGQLRHGNDEPEQEQKNQALSDFRAYYPESMPPDPSSWKVAFGGTPTGDSASLLYNEQTGDALLLLNDDL